MKFKTLLTVMVASLFIGSIGYGCQPVAAQMMTTKDGGTTAGVGGLGGISEMVGDLVASIDNIFGIFVASPNLNTMLRNLSSAMAVFVQHSINEVVSAVYFALYVMLISCVIPPGVIEAVILGVITFIVIAGIGVLRALVDALATFTRVW